LGSSILEEEPVYCIFSFFFFFIFFHSINNFVFQYLYFRCFLNWGYFSVLQLALVFFRFFCWIFDLLFGAGKSLGSTGTLVFAFGFVSFCTQFVSQTLTSFPFVILFAFWFCLWDYLSSQGPHLKFASLWNCLCSCAKIFLFILISRSQNSKVLFLT
jgi:hypothetical protein